MSYRFSKYIVTNGMELHYSEWGSENPETIVCVPGLTRNGRDFDSIAEELSREFRVICIDMIGRGLSQWSETPDVDYSLDRYVSDVVTLVESLEVGRIRWIGTSMGGAVGIRLAASDLKDRITHLVLNDVGPGPLSDPSASDMTLNEGLERIVYYISNPTKFRRMSELVQYYQQVYSSIGLLSKDVWTQFAENSARRMEDGSIVPDYDPAIAVHARRTEELLLWNYWSQIECPVFVLRGAMSDILSSDVFEAMKNGPVRCTGIEISGCGHAPALNTREQIDAIQNFLTQNG